MTRSVSTSIALLCSLALFVVLAFLGCGEPAKDGNGNANANATPKSNLTVNCTAVGITNEQIVAAIYSEILTSNYANEVKQFNITASHPVVKIVGWSTYKAQIVALAKGAATGCAIDDTYFADGKGSLGANYQQRIGCPPNYGPCGDICIPVGEPCKVTSRPAEPPSWNCVPAPTPTPSPTP